MVQASGTGNKMNGSRKLEEAGVTINEIVLTLRQTRGHARLKTEIFNIMTSLNTAELLRQEIADKLQHSSIPLTQALVEILMEWKCRAPDDATIETLIKKFQQLDLTDFAQALDSQFPSLC